MRRLAETASGSPSSWHSLQQFINGSTWSWDAPRRALAAWVEQRASVRAWTIPQITLSKRGDRLVGVHQRFDSQTGRTVNCQAVTTLFLSCPGANFPVDWHLHLPEEWVKDDQLRQEARIPTTATSEPSWQLALDLIKRSVRRAGRPNVPIVADLSEAGELGAAISTLESLKAGFVIAVNPRLRVAADEVPRMHRSGHFSQHGAALSASRCLELYRRRYVYTATMMGDNGDFRQTQILSALIRLPASPRHVYRLFAEPGDDVPEQSPIWLTNLTERRLEELLELVVMHASSKVTVNCMNERLQYLGFSGRSYPGWHHHTTLVSAAYAYSRLAHPALPARAAASQIA
ncbi:hypothetical protein Mth01_48350 [Sphaerimonospora thailandensis]|uniref:Transposase IS701-like DDE domain-containing protein n=2 Tax=Sphaerimonospora thailandensis TaxID=795644 RepID=A0A8J3REW5_9ACTN|nr:hypothetical protein Mth01_48350 [Sphaerimonospora thailandensis]